MPIDQANCIRRFKRICSDGWSMGWHEANGGNLSYRMNQEDIDVCSTYFDVKGPDRQWFALGASAPALGGALFIVTRAGGYMRKVEIDLAENIGIVELSESGDAYRCIWGFSNGGRPTSEFGAHLIAHTARIRATEGSDRVIYHAHCPNIVALSSIMPGDSRAWSRMLWKTTTESVIVMPQGVGVVPQMVPGSAELAVMTGEAMEAHPACIWSLHGILASAPDFDRAFGLVNTIDKACQMNLAARAACGGGEPPLALGDSLLKQICESLGVKANPDYLD